MVFFVFVIYSTLPYYVRVIPWLLLPPMISHLWNMTVLRVRDSDHHSPAVESQRTWVTYFVDQKIRKQEHSLGTNIKIYIFDLTYTIFQLKCRTLFSWKNKQSGKDFRQEEIYLILIEPAERHFLFFYVAYIKEKHRILCRESMGQASCYCALMLMQKRDFRTGRHPWY